MRYSSIISEMVWSPSRISAFEACRYGFLLKYIFEEKSTPQFFSDFGKNMHEIIAGVLTGRIRSTEVASEEFDILTGRMSFNAPGRKVIQSYLADGRLYMLDIIREMQQFNPQLVEHQEFFNVGTIPFTGILDLLSVDGNVARIVDHKSASAVTKRDKQNLIDKYKFQLSVYQIPARKYAKDIEAVLNVYRQRELLKVPLLSDKETEEYATDVVKAANSEDEWKPTVDWFYCNYICDMRKSCEYYETCFGSKR